MSNSSLVNYTLLSPKCSKRRHKIDTITIHCYVGQVTAKEGLKHFYTTTRDSSCNYVVGCDGKIGLCVQEEYRAWTTGGKDASGKVIRVNGISGSDNDHRAVTIEVASDTKHPYAVTKEAYAALVRLVADICSRNGIKELKWRGDKSLVGQVDKQNMTVHRWFANKACPGDYLYMRHADIAREVNYILKEAEDDMTSEEVKKIATEAVKEYLESLKKEPADPYAEEDLAWAKAEGIMKGDASGNQMPKAYITRQDAVAVVHRALTKDNN